VIGASPRRTGRRLLLLLLVLLIMAAAAWHYWTIASSLLGARDDLLSLQERLDRVGFKLENGDIQASREDLRSASDNIERARDHLRFDPLVRLAGFVPKLDDQVEATDGLLDIAEDLAEVGLLATVAGEKAIAVRDGSDGSVPLTQSLVDLLERTDPEVIQMGELLKGIIERRLELGDPALLPPLARIMDRLDEELPQLGVVFEQAHEARAVLPALLGFNGGRQYLVFALNNGELLPGGGIITVAGLMPVADGVNTALDFDDGTLWGPAAEAMGIRYIPPPPPLQRYLLRDYTWNLLTSPWEPDFPTWSQQAREMYELVYGQKQIDGMIAVDLVVLDRLLAVTGPITLDVPGFGPAAFRTGDAILQLEGLTRAAFEPFTPGGVEPNRKDIVGTLAQRLIAELQRLPASKWADAVDALRHLGEQRHIQVFSYDPREQTLLRDVAWDGSVRPGRDDFVQFNDASVMSTKLNLIMEVGGTYRVDVSELGEARHELALTYRNPLPEWEKGRDPKFVYNLMLGGLYGGYLRVFTGRGVSGQEVDLDGQPASVEDIGSAATADWFGAFLPVPSGATRSVTFRWRSHPPAASGREGYRLTVQKQAGGAPICLDLQVTRDGKPARSLLVEGGLRDEEGRICLVSDLRIAAAFD
jgi:hypothetical protein